jgi:hypothetical protein
MAVSVDTVYQRVLAIANKEQRGYITPQEFNLFANQAQMDVFEQYFYDINQVGRGPGNSTEYSNHIDILNEKINLFEMIGDCPRVVDGSVSYQSFKLPNVDNLYRLGTVKHKPINPNIITDPYFNVVNTRNLLTNNTNALSTFEGDGSSIYNTADFSSGWEIQAGGFGTSQSTTTNNLDFVNASAGAFYILRNSEITAGGTYKVSYDVNWGNTNGVMVAFLIVRTEGSMNGSNNKCYVTTTDIHSPSSSFSWYMEGTEIHNHVDIEEIVTDMGTVPDARAALVFAMLVGTSNATNSIDNVYIQQVSTNWDTSSGGFKIGGDLKPSSLPVSGLNSPLSALNNSVYLGEKTSNRVSKIWGKNVWTSPALGWVNPLLWNQTLTAGATYRIRFNVADATKGSLVLYGNLQETYDHANPELLPGIYDSLVLYNYDWDPNGKHVDMYWTQAASTNTRINIRKLDGWDGSITDMSIRMVSDDAKSVEIEHINENELAYALQTKLAAPTLNRPVYARRNNLLNVYPLSIIDGVSCNYIRKPDKVEWNYTEINGTALYNSDSSKDFELHKSEETNLVVKILKLAGISIEDPQLYNIAAREDIFNIQQEKA